ncbi:MAG: hypothetical protein EBU30_07335 [Synechococcaceae bacterium WB6_3B_236]|nr:hypothetical protein [Synechococcaceae bacterium WB6_3B_236]
MAKQIPATDQCITLTDRFGHELLVCELPHELSEAETHRLHHQILTHFHGELEADKSPRRLSWPEVVTRLEERLGVNSSSIGCRGAATQSEQKLDHHPARRAGDILPSAR